MKLILINTPLFRKKDQLSSEDFLPPMGLGYIATYLRQNNIETDLLDAVQQGFSLRKLISYVNKNRPEFVGVNIFTTNYDLVKEFIEALSIKTHIIVGGLATRELYGKIVGWRTSNNIDVVIGDGEKITFDIIRDKIKEKAYISDNGKRVFKISSESDYLVKDISNLKLDRDFLIGEPSYNHYGEYEANLITGRGCIHNCSFCAAARSQNKDYPVRERTINSISGELANLKKAYPEITSIRILDDIFIKSKSSVGRAIDIFSKFDLKWRSMAHIKAFSNYSDSDFKALKRSGCTEFFIGMESGSVKILRSINKMYDKAIMLNNISQIFKAGINIKGYFIYGFPDETEEDMRKTYDLACMLKSLSIKYGAVFRTSVFQFRPYHGTEIFSYLRGRNVEIETWQSTHNKALSEIIGRNQYNFHRGNYSKVGLDMIHDYICKTNNLNDTRNYLGKDYLVNRCEQKKTM